MGKTLSLPRTALESSVYNISTVVPPTHGEFIMNPEVLERSIFRERVPFAVFELHLAKDA